MNKEIKIFLQNNFSNDYLSILNLVQSIFNDINIGLDKYYSKNQIKTLTHKIHPRIALYKAFTQKGYTKEQTSEIVGKCIFEYGKKLNSMYKTIEKIPFMKCLFANIFKNQMLKNDNWKSNIVKSSRNNIEVNIYKCLWYDTCVKNDCKNLCKYFCDVDNVIYNGLKKIIFKRTSTIYYGNEYCDFKYEIH